MSSHNDLGKQGEEIAANFLEKAGYKILERNWRFRKSEVDIIAQLDNLIVIVEVKTRATDYFGNPEESVTLKKQKLLINAADKYVQGIDSDVDIRYDIVAIIKEQNKCDIRHIEDAFIPLLD